MKLKVGDTVQVELPAGWYTGEIMEFKHYPWEDERRVIVEGVSPRPFITNCKISSAVLVEAG